nr:zinc finger, CCHC-type [Tanacetum cinerariifolium]
MRLTVNPEQHQSFPGSFSQRGCIGGGVLGFNGKAGRRCTTTVKIKTTNDDVRLQALTDGKKVVITEAFIRHDHKLNDAEGTSCLSNAVIFEELARIGAKTISWNVFSSTMASVIICLANNKKFNFSKYILDNLKKNLEAGIFVNPSLTKKVFANMKRVGTGFFEAVIPLFGTMMVQALEEVGDLPTTVQDKPIPDTPSSSQHQRKHKPRRKERKETEVSPTEIHTEDHVPTTSNDPLPSARIHILIPWYPKQGGAYTEEEHLQTFYSFKLHRSIDGIWRWRYGVYTQRSLNTLTQIVVDGILVVNELQIPPESNPSEEVSSTGYLIRGCFIIEPAADIRDTHALGSSSLLWKVITRFQDGGENPIVEQLRKRAKWDNDDYVCRGLILNDFKHTLKQLKEELTLIELGTHLRIEESLGVQDSDKPKGNNVVGPSVVNIVEHNNSSSNTPGTSYSAVAQFGDVTYLEPRLAMSSDNAQSAVTYTSISSDSDGPSCGILLMNADEFLEMDPYGEVAQQGHVHPLSPAYVPDPIELDKHVPVHVLEPEHPKYHTPSDDDIQVEDDDEDPEEDPSEKHEPEDDDEDPEEDPNEEHKPEDEDSDKTDPFEEDETAITPPPPRHYGARISIRPQTPMAASTLALIDAFAAASSPFPLPPTSPAHDQAPFGHKAAMIYRKDDIPEEDISSRRRFAFTATPPGCDIA